MTVAESNYPLLDNLERLISEKGLKKNFVAEKAGLTPINLSDMFGGRRLIKPCEIVALAKALGVDYDELFADPELSKEEAAE